MSAADPEALAAPAPPPVEVTVAGDPATLAGRARIVADLLDQVGGGGGAYVGSVDIRSIERYVDSLTGRVETQARLCARSLDGVRAIAEVLGGDVETEPWVHGKPGSLHHAVSAEWRGVQIEAYAIVDPIAGQAERGPVNRRNPPPGFAVERAGGAGWIACNPGGHVVTMGQPDRAAAVRVAWDAADALARMERATQPGWFACAGDNRVGGPYDTRSEAEARLAELVDDGRHPFHAAYGRRDENWVFTALPAPAEERADR